MKAQHFLILVFLLMVAVLAGYFFATDSNQGLALSRSSPSASKSSGDKNRQPVATAQTRFEDAGWPFKVRKTGAFITRILAEDLNDYQPVSYPEDRLAYEGEPVMAHVLLPSSNRRLALTPNQNGEYPRVLTEPGEAVEVLLTFSQSSPGSFLAVSAQDGGFVHTGAAAAALKLDENRQVTLGFLVSGNPGIHRISLTTANGDTRTLQFWAGPELPLNSSLLSRH